MAKHLFKTKEHLHVNGVELKWCPRCGRWLPLDAFTKDRTRVDGLHGFCRDCSYKVNKNAYSLNKETKKTKVMKYFRTEKGTAVNKASNARRRLIGADVNGITVITGKDIVDILNKYGGKCAYCGTMCRDRYQLDHKIPVSRGGDNSIENIAISCERCNMKKYTKTDIEFCGRSV